MKRTIRFYCEAIAVGTVTVSLLLLVMTTVSGVAGYSFNSSPPWLCACHFATQCYDSLSPGFTPRRRPELDACSSASSVLSFLFTGFTSGALWYVFRTKKV